MITGQANSGTSSSANGKVAEEAADQERNRAAVRARELDNSKKLAEVVDASVGRRKSVPIRKSFVRSEDPDELAPLAQLVSGGGGRGGAVAVKLYVALIWKCAGAPFTVKRSARQWAQLLGLPDAAGKGARRVTNALQVLESLRLIKLDKTRGEASEVTLLDESGDGQDYQIPSTAWSRGGKKRDLYFQISSKLWTSGEFQSLSGPGLTMLLILLTEEGYKPGSNLPLTVASLMSPLRSGKDVWFTTENFPARYGISAATRSRGTKELEEAGLLHTWRMPVGPKNELLTFSTEKVRKVYVLLGNAVIGVEEDGKPAAKKPAKKAGPAATSPKRKHLLPSTGPVQGS